LIPAGNPVPVSNDGLGIAGHERWPSPCDTGGRRGKRERNAKSSLEDRTSHATTP
jgi:hypothetical protein